MSTISASTTSTTAYKVTADTTGTLVLQTGSTPTTAVTIDTAQNVGVGVTPSAWGSGYKAIDISGNGSFYGTSATAAQVWNAYNNGTNWIYKSTNSSALYLVGAGTHTWYNAAGGTAGNAISFTQAMTLDASGNLLVGGTSTAALDGVFGAVVGGASKTSGGVAYESSTSQWATYTSDSGQSYIFYDSRQNAERARIDSSGNLLVGQTTAQSAPSAGFCFNAPTTASYGAIGHANGSASGTGFFYFSYNAGFIGSITQNGTTGVLYNLTSDYRLKNNPEALTGAKEFVMALQPKKWQWWDGSGEGVGFIAHEFMEVAKHSGNGEKDAVETIEIKDEDGNVTGTEERPVYQSIQPSSSEVMANLVAFIQEQQAVIEQLKADVAALKG